VSLIILVLLLAIAYEALQAINHFAGLTADDHPQAKR
jgi:uncharacterized membrane protein YwzB